MKHLQEYLVHETYEPSLLESHMINEGILSSLGKGIKKLGEKVVKAGEKTDEIKGKFSDAAKKSWERLIKKNPDIEKDNEQEQVVAKTHAAVDDAMQQHKQEVENFSKTNNVAVDELQEIVDNILLSATENPKTQFVADIITNGDSEKMYGLEAMVMGLLAAKKNGIDANQMGALMGVINKQK